jgi:hypothetical protein
MLYTIGKISVFSIVVNVVRCTIVVTMYDKRTHQWFQPNYGCQDILCKAPIIVGVHMVKYTQNWFPQVGEK